MVTIADPTLFSVLLVGSILIYFYGRQRFNSPDYAIRTPSDLFAHGADYNSLAELRALVPPMFATTRNRYKKYQNRYILVLEVAFITFTVFPELIEALFSINILPRAAIGSLDLADPLHRGLFICLMIAGVLPNFPGLRDIDTRFIKSLHMKAVIPVEARRKAVELFQSDFLWPATEEMRRTLSVLKKANITEDAIQNRSNMSYLIFKIGHTIRKSKEAQGARSYDLFAAKFQDEWENIDSTWARLLDQARLFSREEDELLVSWKSRNADPKTRQRLKRQSENLKRARDDLRIRLEALHFRICQLASIMVFSGERSIAEIQTRFREMGFDVTVQQKVQADWDALVKGIGFTFLSIVVTSTTYHWIITRLDIPQPPELLSYVPLDIADAFLWAMVGITIHGGAALTAIILRNRIRFATRLTRSCIIGAICYAVAFAFLSSFNFSQLYDEVFSYMAPWAFLPATTGFFTALYLPDAHTISQRERAHRISQQIGTMALVGAMAAILSMSDHVNDYGEFALMFTGFCSLTAAVIGGAMSFALTWSATTWRPSITDSTSLMATSKGTVIPT